MQCRRTYVKTTPNLCNGNRKIESVSHQIEITVIANKTLLVCDGYLCLSIGGKCKNNHLRSFDNFGLIVQLDYNLCECEFEHQNSTIPMYLRIKI